MNNAFETKYFIIGSQKSGTSWLRNCLRHCIRIESPEWYYSELYSLMLGHVEKFGSSLAEADRKSRAERMAVAAWTELLSGHQGDKSAYPSTPWPRPDIFPFAVQHVKTHFLNARSVVIIRDPRATYNSLKHYLNHFSQGWSERLSPVEFAENWALNNKTWLDDDPDVVVLYEKLKSDFEGSMARIIDGVNISVEPGMVAEIRAAEFDVATRRSEHPEIYRTGTVDEWKVALDRAEVEAIENVAGPLMDRLGYERLQAS